MGDLGRCGGSWCSAGDSCGDRASVARRRTAQGPRAGVLYILRSILYDFLMASMNISAARERLPEAVELAHSEAVFLERYGRRAAVLVSPERYDELMEALEEAEDVAAFDAAMAEEGPNIPWDQAKADLGWM
jgi:antitoxin Phd